MIHCMYVLEDNSLMQMICMHGMIVAVRFLELSVLWYVIDACLII